MNTITAAIQGSGWGWLGFNPSTKKLEIVTTPNQDPLLCTSLAARSSHRALSLTSAQRTFPLSALTSGSMYVSMLTLDAFSSAVSHDPTSLQAFYLQYKNVKPDVSLAL